MVRDELIPALADEKGTPSAGAYTSSREVVPEGIPPCNRSAAVQLPENEGDSTDVRYPDLQCCQKERAPVAAPGGGQQRDELDQCDPIAATRTEVIVRDGAIGAGYRVAS